MKDSKNQKDSNVAKKIKPLADRVIIKEEAERAKKINELKSQKEGIKKQLDELYSDEELEEEELL